ncbi:MAG: DNA-3-methyladenine glycosylase 2 family protein [Coriobacteriia bacterium]|nr:DNA-3-methyladenine glycosylase 2 family protein [Coriobacteriia bacterium]
MPNTIRYTPDDEPSRALAAADPRLGALIARVGGVEFTRNDGADRFAMLVRGVAGQQLSGAAAQHIFDRLSEQIGMTPRALAEASDEQLLGVGLSHRKAEYIRDLARAVLTCEVDLAGVDNLTDEQIVAQLTSVRGIGPWTAHMFLLFALHRPDVIAPGDLGIRQAAGRLLELGREATPAEVESAAELWRPYRSAATFYLYREAGMGREAVRAEAHEGGAASE